MLTIRTTRQRGEKETNHWTRSGKIGVSALAVTVDLFGYVKNDHSDHS
jgi:hypothetical protein